MKVFSNQCPQSSDRVVQCIGKADQCVDSVREIFALIKEVPIKGPIQNYDPINYDDLYADKYGGFGEGNNGGGGGNRDGGRGGGRGDRGGRDNGGAGGNQGGSKCILNLNLSDLYDLISLINQNITRRWSMARQQ